MVSQANGMELTPVRTAVNAPMASSVQHSQHDLDRVSSSSESAATESLRGAARSSLKPCDQNGFRDKLFLLLHGYGGTSNGFALSYLRVKPEHAALCAGRWAGLPSEHTADRHLPNMPVSQLAAYCLLGRSTAVFIQSGDIEGRTRP